jgi:alpha-beta hydrolase superfamily lysophospholipase
MTVVDQQVSAAAWNEPEGVAPRGTLIVIPGRGEQPGLYERFGRRLSADAYRVRLVTDPTADAAAAREQVAAHLADPATTAPAILVGSDTGALFAIILADSGDFPGVGGLILAGLPSPGHEATRARAALSPGPGTAEAGPGTAEAGPGTTGAGPEAAEAGPSWDEELDARTFCPTHRGRLSASALRRGALYEPVPAGWAEQADLAAVPVPVLAVHGGDDPLSPLADARARYATARLAELVSISGGRHDALNDQDHRTVAATVVQFLERLRRPGGGPIAVREDLAQP